MSFVRSQPYRPSPNEEARLLQEERNRRRKLRIVQVREQAKVNASRIRDAVQKEKEKQLEKLAEALRAEWLQKQQEEVERLEQLYQQNVVSVGKSHEGASEEVAKDLANQKLIEQVQANCRAAIRGSVALQHELEERKRQMEDEQRIILARKQALEVERERASEIASRPPPPVNPVDHIETPSYKPIKCIDKNAFAQTHYHLVPEHDVIREDDNKENAAVDAEEAQVVIDQKDKERERLIAEYREKARLRGKSALEQEMLKQDYERLLLELSDLRKEDSARRQQNVHQIPKQLFSSVHQQAQEQRYRQSKMERAFEDVYAEAAHAPDPRRDLSHMTLVEHQPTPPTASQDLDVSHTETPEHSRTSSRKEMVAAAKPSDAGLKKLLGRIRSQRDTVSQDGGSSTAAGASQHSSFISANVEQRVTGSAGVDRSQGEMTGLDNTAMESEAHTSVLGSLSTGTVTGLHSSVSAETASNLASLEEGSIKTGDISSSQHHTTLEEGSLMSESSAPRPAATYPNLATMRQLVDERTERLNLAMANTQIAREALSQQEKLWQQHQQLQNHIQELTQRKAALEALHNQSTASSEVSSVTGRPIERAAVWRYQQQLLERQLGTGRPYTQEEARLSLQAKVASALEKTEELTGKYLAVRPPGSGMYRSQLTAHEAMLDSTSMSDAGQLQESNAFLSESQDTVIEGDTGITQNDGNVEQVRGRTGYSETLTGYPVYQNGHVPTVYGTYVPPSFIRPPPAEVQTSLSFPQSLPRQQQPRSRDSTHSPQYSWDKELSTGTVTDSQSACGDGPSPNASALPPPSFYSETQPSLSSFATLPQDLRNQNAGDIIRPLASFSQELLAQQQALNPQQSNSGWSLPDVQEQDSETEHVPQVSQAATTQAARSTTTQASLDSLQPGLPSAPTRMHALYKDLSTILEADVENTTAHSFFRPPGFAVNESPSVVVKDFPEIESAWIQQHRQGVTQAVSKPDQAHYLSMNQQGYSQPGDSAQSRESLNIASSRSNALSTESSFAPLPLASKASSEVSRSWRDELMGEGEGSRSSARKDEEELSLHVQQQDREAVSFARMGAGDFAPQTSRGQRLFSDSSSNGSPFTSRSLGPTSSTPARPVAPADEKSLPSPVQKSYFEGSSMGNMVSTDNSSTAGASQNSRDTALSQHPIMDRSSPLYRKATTGSAGDGQPDVGYRSSTWKDHLTGGRGEESNKSNTLMSVTDSYWPLPSHLEEQQPDPYPADIERKDRQRLSLYDPSYEESQAPLVFKEPVASGPGPEAQLSKSAKFRGFISYTGLSQGSSITSTMTRSGSELTYVTALPDSLQQSSASLQESPGGKISSPGTVSFSPHPPEVRVISEQDSSCSSVPNSARSYDEFLQRMVPKPEEYFAKVSADMSAGESTEADDTMQSYTPAPVTFVSVVSHQVEPQTTSAKEKAGDSQQAKVAPAVSQEPSVPVLSQEPLVIPASQEPTNSGEKDASSANGASQIHDVTLTESVGILEEPELSLLSIDSDVNNHNGNAHDKAALNGNNHHNAASSSTSQQAPPPAQSSQVVVRTSLSPDGKNVSKEDSSLLSFEKHEYSLDVSSSSSGVSNKNNNCTATEVIYHTDQSEGEDRVVSLQEAFLRKKQRFIENSRARKEAAEEKARKKALEAKAAKEEAEQRGEATRPASQLLETMNKWKKTHCLNTGLGQASCSNTESTIGASETKAGFITKTSRDRKIDEKEMKERTSRLYGKSEEIKKKKKEEERKKQYAENREKAKQYSEARVLPKRQASQEKGSSQKK